MSWYHDFDGGRAWYTNMGHTEATFAEPLFLQALLGGLRYAMGTRPLDFTRARPEENRFTKVVLAEKLDEPVELAVLPGERVLFIERHGYVNLYTPATKHVDADRDDPRQHEVHGQRVRRRTACSVSPPIRTSRRNGWVYMYYSPAGPEPKNVLARFTMKGDSLDLASEKILLEIPAQRDQCCHTGGSIAFDAHGNLFISTGDNTNPFATGYAPIDERPGRMPWDAQKSSANTNDLRGKIIRIHPEPDGTYTIPDGQSLRARERRRRGPRSTRWVTAIRIASRWTSTPASSTGATSVPTRRPTPRSAVRGATTRSTRRARPGNFGWPYFVGDNKAYFDYDFADERRSGQAVRSRASGQRLAEQHGAHRAAAGAEGVHLVSRARSPTCSRSSAPADARRWRARFSTATISRTRRAPSRSTTTESSSSTSGCAAGSWRSR